MALVVHLVLITGLFLGSKNILVIGGTVSRSPFIETNKITTSIFKNKKSGVHPKAIFGIGGASVFIICSFFELFPIIFRDYPLK